MSKQFLKKLAAYSHSLIALLKTDFGIALCITLTWQIILTLAGYIIDTKLHLPTSGLFSDMPEGILGHTLRWDSGWYMEIIRSDFYQHTTSQGAVFAFYPLYPLLVALVSGLSFGLISLQAASLIITTIATVAALTALIKISSHLLPDRRSAILVGLLFILSPAAMFLHVFYSEAVFIAIGSWAYLFALRRRWAYMAVSLAILSLARLPAILFVALCGLEFVRAHQWNIKKAALSRSSLWFLIVPLGFVAYSAWCYAVNGDLLAMFHAYKASDGWPYQVFNPNIIHTVAQACWTLAADMHNHVLNKGIIVNSILPLGSIFILFATAIYAIFIAKGPFIPLGIFNLLAIVFFTLNSNVTSVHRYSLACISIFIIAILFFGQHKKLSWMLYIGMVGCFVIQLGLLILFVTGHFAG